MDEKIYAFDEGLIPFLKVGWLKGPLFEDANVRCCFDEFLLTSCYEKIGLG
jgi:hypothetical protein